MNMTNDNNNTTMKFLKKYFFTLILLWTCLWNIFRNIFQLFVYYKCKQTVRKTISGAGGFTFLWPFQPSGHEKVKNFWPFHMNLGKTHPKKYFYDEKKILLKSHCHLYCCCCLIHCCIQYDCCWKRFQQQIWILYLPPTKPVATGSGSSSMMTLEGLQMSLG